LRFFEDELKKNEEKYKEFYIEYNMFLKEGAVQDYPFMEQISKLLMFESSIKNEGFFTFFL
jgi:molecular chaperone HtpG